MPTDRDRLLRAVGDDFAVLRGHPLPFGATRLHGGVNFSIFSRHATAMTLVLFVPGDPEPLMELPLDRELNRTGDVWHVFVQGLAPGFEYGYRAERTGQKPSPLHRFDPAVVLLDPYARALSGPSLWRGASREASRAAAWRGVLVDETFDWEFDRPLKHHLADTVIYELHVRGFTRHPSSGVAHPGTYRGVIEKIPYLQELGVTAVELLPVTEFDEADNFRVNPQTGEPLHNLWGYHPVNFFAPKAAYAVDPAPGAELREFREMVKALHRAGIEVILDLVFNHTGEGNEQGRTLSFRGFDNSVYYLLDPKTGAYANYSGCGNTVNCNHPVVRNLIVDALCWWVTEMHVDGFRFDLAAILARGPDGQPLANPPLIEQLAANPVLADAKLIAEAWDAAGLYQVGTFPNFGRWAEWNGKFRDDLRCFVRGDAGMVPLLATRLAGSSDLYQDDGRAPFHSINFITCHDGFTLADLVSFERKHNEANGEHNVDGSDVNFSSHCGSEGPLDDPAIQACRARRIRNFSALLLLAHGVPMWLAGDEFGNSQGGNNNAWCQDNAIGWLDWSGLEAQRDLFAFCRHLIAFRRLHPLLRPRHFEGEESGERRLTWHGPQLFKADWSEKSHSLGMHLQGLKGEAEVYLIAHAATAAQTFALPKLAPGRQWRRFVDTACEPASVAPGEEPILANQGGYAVSGESVVVLVGA
ncbi:MAG: glycogen debranching protein GlgX [Desulfuromonadales bacterium]|nr:glycogen debranching protein GlgX [Desulfuromonadales bacterium]